MPTTPNLALPYPAASDPADVPADIQALATKLDGLKLAAGTEVGYDQITATVTVSSTTEAAGTVVIPGSAHVFDGGPVVAEFSTPEVTTGTGGTIVINLFEGATQIGRLAAILSGTGIANGVPVTGKIRFTPTAGPHTYSVTGIQATGNGSVAAGPGGAAAFVPAFLRFTKV